MKGKVMLSILLIAVASSYLIVHYLQFPYGKVGVYSGNLTFRTGEKVKLSLPPLEDEDRVLIELFTSANIQMYALQGERRVEVMPVTIEGAKYRLVDYLINIQRGLFIAEKGEDNYLILESPFPLTRYHLLFLVNERSVNVNLSEVQIDGENCLNVTLIRKKAEGALSIMLVHMVDLIIASDFELILKAAVQSSHTNTSLALNLMSATDNYLYTKELSFDGDRKLQSYMIEDTSQKYWRHGSIVGDTVTAIGLTLTLGENDDQASFLIGKVKIRNNAEEITIDPDLKTQFNAPYKVYITHKYSPNIYSAASWIAIFTATFYLWYTKGGRETCENTHG